MSEIADLRLQVEGLSTRLDRLAQVVYAMPEVRAVEARLARASAEAEADSRARAASIDQYDRLAAARAAKGRGGERVEAEYVAVAGGEQWCGEEQFFVVLLSGEVVTNGMTFHPANAEEREALLAQHRQARVVSARRRVANASANVERCERDVHELANGCGGWNTDRDGYPDQNLAAARDDARAAARALEHLEAEALAGATS